MITLGQDQLVFRHPDVHEDAVLSIGFQRTLRIPDDAKTYGLPPGLGLFPLLHVDDYATSVSPEWVQHGGVMLPMYQAEAMWLNFDSEYPYAIKVATGKVNAVDGKTWRQGLHRRPQDYVVVPDQPWLDGYCVGKGTIRQFVAAPLGLGCTTEEQITGKAEVGGLQIEVFPLKASVYRRDHTMLRETALCYCASPAVMGLAPGGKMRQEIYADTHSLEDWDLEHGSRCFVHICNSMIWESITGRNPPTVPPTARSYTEAGLPWFDYYDEKQTALPGTATLAGLKGMATVGPALLPENDPVQHERRLKILRDNPSRVREWNA